MQRKHLIVFCFIFFIPFWVWSQENIVIPKESMTIDSSTRALLIKKAKEYIGVQYHHGQSNKTGFDCSGFVKYIFEKFDFSLPHNSRDQYHKAKQIKNEEAKPGDLVFFITLGKQISHVGIYLGDHMFIHAPSKGKKVSISSLDEVYYKKRLVGFGSVL